MDPIGKLIKVLLALALTGLALYFFGPHPARGALASAGPDRTRVVLVAP